MLGVIAGQFRAQKVCAIDSRITNRNLLVLGPRACDDNPGGASTTSNGAQVEITRTCRDATLVKSAQSGTKMKKRVDSVHSKAEQNGAAAEAFEKPSTLAVPRRGRRNRIHPRNWGFTTHLDKVFGLRCFEDLVRLAVFPDAKDISESYGALLGACRSLGGTTDSIREVQQRRGVLVLSIGDGATPRTAALVSYLTRWHAVAIDPALRPGWRGAAPNKVERLWGFAEKFEDWIEQHDSVQEISEAVVRDAAAAPVRASNQESFGDGPELHDLSQARQASTLNLGKDETTHIQHLVLLCVHAHNRFTGSATIENVRLAFGNPPTVLVSLPCCHQFNPTNDIGRQPDDEYEDEAIFSDCRKVQIWKF